MAYLFFELKQALKHKERCNIQEEFQGALSHRCEIASYSESEFPPSAQATKRKSGESWCIVSSRSSRVSDARRLCSQKQLLI